MFHQIMTCLYFAVLMPLCVMCVKKFFWGCFVLPLIPVLVVFHINLANLFKWGPQGLWVQGILSHCLHQDLHDLPVLINSLIASTSPN